MRPTQAAGARPRDHQTESLRRLTYDPLRRALCADGSGGPPDADVRMLLRQLCDTAHERGVPAEQLLILLKEGWRELPEARHGLRFDARDVLAHVITLCIDEYYAPGRRP